MLLLVATCAGFLAVFQYRQGVYDPTVAHLRQVRYGDASGKVAAIRELLEGDFARPAVTDTLLVALSDADPAVRVVAAQALADITFQIAPAVHPADDTKGDTVPDDPRAVRVKAALTELLRDSDPAVRLRAASGLSLLHVKTDESFAIIIRAARTPIKSETRFSTVGEPDDRFRALGDLAYTYRDKPESLAAILEAVADRDPRARRRGIIALNLYLRKWTGAVPEAITDALFARLDDEEDSIRGEATLSLGLTGRRIAPRAVPVLIKKLAEPQSTTRKRIAEALGGFGLYAEDARPALRSIAESTDDAALRTAAREALETIDKECRVFHDQTLPELIADLHNVTAEIRTSAAQTLAEHGARAKAAIPDLTQALDDPEPKVRRAASAALAAAGVAPAEQTSNEGAVPPTQGIVGRDVR
jgi:HEAT repeat protein